MVDFFFVLSGFCTPRAFWTERRAPFNFYGMYGARVRACTLACGYVVHRRGAAGLRLMMRLAAAPFIYRYNDTYHFAPNALLLNGSGLQQGFSFNAPAGPYRRNSSSMWPSWVSSHCRPRLLASASLLGAVAIATMATRGLINGTRAFAFIDNDLVRTGAGFMVGVAAAAGPSRARWSLPRWGNDLLALLIVALGDHSIWPAVDCGPTSGTCCSASSDFPSWSRR